jgi:hypothetical protein
MIKTIGIFIRESKAYVPTVARLDSGVYQQIAPVYTADLTVDELTAAVEQAIAAGHTRLPHPSEEELKHYRNPLLAATRARSLKALIKSGASYTIAWADDAVILYLSARDKQGRFIYGPAIRFPLDSPIRPITQAILDDVPSHPEVLSTAKTS